MCENCGCDNKKIYQSVSEMAKRADEIVEKYTSKKSCDCGCDDECIECGCEDCDCEKK